MVEEREERFPDVGVVGANRTREVGSGCFWGGWGCLVGVELKVCGWVL